MISQCKNGGIPRNVYAVVVFMFLGATTDADMT